MKILVIGFGSIGQRHTRLLSELYPGWEISVLREHSKSKEVGELKDKVKNVFTKRKEGLALKPEAVFICNPAPWHIETAVDFAKMGSHLFIEKPLSVSLEGVDELIDLCRKRGSILTIGYVLRFLKPLNVVKEILQSGRIGKVLSVNAVVGSHLLNWRTGNFRDQVSARKDLGGGVVFELSHEIHYLRWLMGEIIDVKATLMTVSDLGIDVEDVAEINLHFANGALGHIHMDMVDRAYNRSLRVMGTKGTLSWDYTSDQTVQVFDADKQIWSILYSDKHFDRDTMYGEQIKHFFQCIENHRQPEVSGEDGKRILEIILSIKESAREGGLVRT